MAKSKVEKWLTPEGLTLLNGWARDGLTDEQIAKNMQISTSTYYDYRNKYVEISEALKKGKEIIDYEVENALLKRAKGYSYNEITHETALNPENGKFEFHITKVVEREVPPDVGAAMAWLKNRKPDKWRDKPQEQNKDDEGVTIIDDLPKSESN